MSTVPAEAYAPTLAPTEAPTQAPTSAPTNECSGGSITSQSTISNFAGCTHLTSALNIVNANSDVTDLSALSRLRSAKTLNIQNQPQLETLNGLEGLESIDGELVIIANAVLFNISALRNLGGGVNKIHVYNNYMLPSLNGLQNVASVGNFEVVADCTYYKGDAYVTIRSDGQVKTWNAAKLELTSCPVVRKPTGYKCCFGNPTSNFFADGLAGAIRGCTALSG